jgi:hypothetical protein
MSAIPWIGRDLVEFLWGGLIILLLITAPILLFKSRLILYSPTKLITIGSVPRQAKTLTEAEEDLPRLIEFNDLHFTDTLKTARATRDVWCILLL